MRKRVLFVDDEPKVLSGLERSFRTMRNQWDVRFAPGGQEALDAMAREPFDVVISDMRMPGIDGAHLLEMVKKQFPQTVRMVLSGQSDRDAVFRSTKPTHQYFSKPCDIEELKQKLTRALALGDVLDNPKLRQLVSQVETVPSLPSLCKSLRVLLESPNPSTAAVADIVVQDPGIAAKLLQLVNSAFLGVASHHSNPRKAASVIGIDNLRALVSLDLFSELPPDLLKKLEGVWKHSQAAAFYAHAIARSEGLAENAVQDCFAAGLLHDIGRLVLASLCRDEYDETVRRTQLQGISLVASECQVFGATHAQVGAYLLGLWGLPDSIVEAVAWHHEPSQARPKSFCPLIAVHVADVCERQIHAGSGRLSDRVIDVPLLTDLGLHDHLPAWEETCRTIAGKEEKK